VLAGCTVPAAGSYCAGWNFCTFIPAVGTKADGAACPSAVRLDLTTEPLGQPEQTSQRFSAQPNEARQWDSEGKRSGVIGDSDAM